MKLLNQETIYKAKTCNDTSYQRITPRMAHPTKGMYLLVMVTQWSLCILKTFPSFGIHASVETAFHTLWAIPTKVFTQREHVPSLPQTPSSQSGKRTIRDGGFPAHEDVVTCWNQVCTTFSLLSRLWSLKYMVGTGWVCVAVYVFLEGWEMEENTCKIVLCNSGVIRPALWSERGVETSIFTRIAK